MSWLEERRNEIVSLQGRALYMANRASWLPKRQN